VILADFYHKSFTFRQNATAFILDGSKESEGAVGAAVFSPEDNIRSQKIILNTSF